MSEKTLTPEVLWAQRSSSSDPAKNYVYLTINIPDVKEGGMKLDIQPTYVEAKGHSETKKADYGVKLELYEEIVPEETKQIHTGGRLELVLRKKDLKEEFWPRLLKEKGKVHFLRTDFDKWVDEDEQEGNPDDEDFMSKMGGMGGGPGAGAGGFEGIDFSKLGAGPGMGGDEDLPEDGSDDDEDEDMPELEGEEDSKTGASASSTSGKAKIEEVE